MSWKYILKERNPFMNRLLKVLQNLASQAKSRGIYIETSKNLVSKYIRELEGTEFLSVPKIEEVMLEALSAPLNVFQNKLQDEQFQEDLQEIADLGEIAVLEEEPDPEKEQFKFTPKQIEVIKNIAKLVTDEAMSEVRKVLYSALDELREDLQDSMDSEIDRVKINETEKKVKNTLKELVKDKQFKINYTFNVTQDMVKLGVIERMIIDRSLPEGDKIYPIEMNALAQILGEFISPFPKDFDWVSKSWPNHLRD